MKICTTNSEERRIGIRKLVVVAFWILAWQIFASFVGNDLLLPGPLVTCAAMFELAGTGKFYINIGWTFLRCVCAMILSFAAGAVSAAASYRFCAVRSLLSLPVGFFKAVPVMAVIIYVILIASADWVAIIVCFLMCFPIAYTNILSGLDSMGKEFKELAYVYELSLKDRVRYIYRPGIMPQINSAARLIAGLSWKAVVAAEVLAIPKYSIGYEMMNAKYYLQTPVLFSYIFTIIILSIAVERCVTLFLNKNGTKGYSGSKLSKNLQGMQKKGNDCKKPNHKLPEVRLQGVEKSFNGKAVLSELDTVFEAGKVTVIEGPSGIGKTTLGRIIAGLETADRGEVIADGKFKLSYLFQEDRLLPWLNGYDNLALGLLRDKKNDKNSVSNRISSKNDIMEMAENLEISQALYKMPAELSGGMKHRVALGRTFLADSNIVILDEPFRGLDDELTERIMRRIWDDSVKDKTVIVITHKPEIFSRYNKLKI